MKRGLVLGKFHPLHVGHIALINFAASQCDDLIVMICEEENETISGDVRLNWVREIFSENTSIKPILLNYKDSDLPSTSVASRDISRLWAEKIKEFLPPIDVFISSEEYGEFVAESLGCESIVFDLNRSKINISASKILKNPFQHWNFLAESAKPYFVKKICIYGTESTGKSTLTEKLAKHYRTVFVPEMARDIVEGSQTCTKEDLAEIAEVHAKAINETLPKANKLLFIDTDLSITSSYSKFLFNEKLIVKDWVKTANKMDLYIYLDKDAPFHQDGTRLEIEGRNLLDASHRNELDKKNCDYHLVAGDWDERLKKSVEIIANYLNIQG